MTLAILIFSDPTEDQFTGGEQIEAAAVKRGHKVVKLYEPFLAFADGRITHQGSPLPALDAIVCRPNYVCEPSLHSYAPDLLAQAGYRVINNGAAISIAKNKIAQHVVFAANGLPTPRWVIAQRSEDIIEAAANLGLPVILKVAFGTHGKGVFYADSLETLQPIADYLAVRDNNPVLVEEYIAQANRKDLRIFVIGERIVAAMERAAGAGDIRANTSLGGHGSIVTLTDEEQHLALRAAKLVGLDITGVDIIRSNRGPLLLEVNANPGFKELERVTGVDIAGAIVEYALQPLPRST